MPIKGLTDRTRIPRLGKIHLGEKVTNAKGVEYPKATDYFVCPPEVQKLYGEKPKELRIMFPIDAPDIIASQFYRCYSKTRGLLCKGDGETATALVDTRTGEIAAADATETELKEITCDPLNCPRAEKKYCKPMMCLQFLLPEVPGFGVWQIDTSSINSILNINATLNLLKRGKGHIDFIELLLKLEPQEVQAEGKKKTVFVLRLDIPGTLLSLAHARNPLQLSAPAAMPTPDDERPEDLFPDAEGEVVEAQASAEPAKPEPDKAEHVKPPPTPTAPPKGTPPDPAKEIVRLKAQLREVLKVNGLEGKSAADWVGQQSLEKYNEAPGNLTAEQWMGLVMEARKQFEPPQEAGDK